jgi:hypothetical protein
MTNYRRFALVLPIAGALILGACGSRESEAERHREANTPAGKTGQAAHSVAKEVGKAAHTVSKEIGKAAHEAREGWKEAAAEDKAKQRNHR